ncbi:hypothetical protein BGZ67_001351 [Mortierella alpina]|nr:hypothetical protein BGZ67_001351 [Mortierella alpina]
MKFSATLLVLAAVASQAMAVVPKPIKECTQTVVVKPTDTGCIQFATDNHITFKQLLAWNYKLSPKCDNLDVNEPMCVSITPKKPIQKPTTPKKPTPKKPTPKKPTPPKKEKKDKKDKKDKKPKKPTHPKKPEHPKKPVAPKTPEVKA